MPILRIPLSFVVLGAAVAGGQSQAEAPPEGAVWDVSLPVPVTHVEPVESIEPLVLTFPEVISSHTSGQFVTEASPELGLPPVAGTINVTVQVVAPPDLPEPGPPLAALPPDAPAVQARIGDLRGRYQATELYFVSAIVYDHSRTFIRVYPNGHADKVVSAWSNLDFNVFNGWSTYRIANGDGTFRETGLLMGVSNFQTAAMQTLAAKAGTAYLPPPIPALPDLTTAGPKFEVSERALESPAMDTLQQIHDLFRKEGERMTDAYIERKSEEADRKAALLASPPTPSDVTIRYWKGEADAAGTEVAE